jgi:hypothetical protein
MASVATLVHLGHDKIVHPETKSNKGHVRFEADEDLLLFFTDPTVFDADAALVKAGAPLDCNVDVEKGYTKCFLVRAADFDKFFRQPKSSSQKGITRVPGSPIEITVP